MLQDIIFEIGTEIAVKQLNDIQEGKQKCQNCARCSVTLKSLSQAICIRRPEADADDIVHRICESASEQLHWMQYAR